MLKCKPCTIIVLFCFCFLVCTFFVFFLFFFCFFFFANNALPSSIFDLLLHLALQIIFLHENNSLQLLRYFWFVRMRDDLSNNCVLFFIKRSSKLFIIPESLENLYYKFLENFFYRLISELLWMYQNCQKHQFFLFFFVCFFPNWFTVVLIIHCILSVELITNKKVLWYSKFQEHNICL